MAAVGVDLTLDLEPAFGGKPGLAAGERLRGRQQRGRDRGERDRGAGAVLAPHDAADDVEIVGRRLHELRRHVERLVAQLERGDMRRRGGHHRRARGMGADAELDAVGLAVGDAHPRDVDAEGLRGNLRHHRLEALADRCAAGDHLDRARGIDRDLDAVRRAEAALLHEHGDAGADELTGGAAAPQVGLQRRSRRSRPAPFRAVPCSRRCRSGFPRRALRADAHKASRPR